MRDRGITHSAPKAGIALAVAVAGATALAWSLADEAPPAGRSLGAIALVLGTGFVLNYLYTLSLMRRLRRGENIVARWHVAPPPPSLCSSRRNAHASGARTIGAAGARIAPRASKSSSARTRWWSAKPISRCGGGVSRITHTHIERGAATYIQFAMTVTMGPGPQTPTTKHRGHLRMPVADDAGVEAARVVVGHFARGVQG